MLDVGELAQALDALPQLSADCVPTPPLLVLDIDTAAAAPDAQLARAADAARTSLALVVGVASKPPHPRVAALLDAATLTLAPAPVVGSQQALVPVDSVEAALLALEHRIAASPRAAIVLGQVLRQTAVLDVRAGLAAEAAAYGVLLAGSEFRSWLGRRGSPRPAPRSIRPPVSVERRDDRLCVLLDRPERRNAMDAALRDGLVDALTLALASPDVSVHLSGRGSAFCSGGDLDEFGTAPGVDAAYLLRLARHPGWLLHRLGERAVVRVHGACIGAGVEMPSLASRVVATEDAYFALPELAMGLIPGAGGTVGLTRRAGRWRTAWLALTGNRIPASTALAWGLVDEVITS